MANESIPTKTKVPTADKRKWVEIGPIPINAEDPQDKYVSVGVNGKTIMLERGKSHKVPEEFAEAYKHRVAMQARRLRGRAKMKEELVKKQSSEGVSFM